MNKEKLLYGHRIIIVKAKHHHVRLPFNRIFPIPQEAGKHAGKRGYRANAFICRDAGGHHKVLPGRIFPGKARRTCHFLRAGRALAASVHPRLPRLL